MSGLLKRILPPAAGAAISSLAVAAPLPPDATYRPLPTQPLDVVKAIDEADKPGVIQRQRQLLEQRYDLSDRPMQGVMMSGGRKPVQDGVRVRLAPGTTWDALAAMSPGEIRVRATSAGWSFLEVPTLVSIMSARSKNSVSVAPGIRQVTETPESISSWRNANEKLSRNALLAL
jgi:hypothetical protein